MLLPAVRARVEEARGEGAEPLALALLEQAEAEPILGHRQAAVRAPLEQAAALIAGNRGLEGRALLRLGELKLSEGDLEGAEQLADRARDRLGDTDTDRLHAATALRVRAAIRRKDFATAEAQLAETSAALGDEPTTTAGRRALATIALAWAELAIEQEAYPTAQTRLEVLAGIADDGRDDELIEADFACRQLRAAMALAAGDANRAFSALRDTIALAKRLGAVEEELEARIALAGSLVQRGDLIGRDEAEKHLQITRDKAIEHQLDALHMSALVGQAGLLAQKGQTQAALDRSLEIAQAAAEKQDLPRYAAAVALMSQIYEQKGDLSSAYRTFAEAHSALKANHGDAATALFRPYLVALSERVGPKTFQEIAERVNKASHARQTFRRRS